MDAPQTKVSEALTKIAEGLRIASGYPDNTVQDSAMAFAYGLMIGAAWAMIRDWEEREHGHKKES